MITVPTVALALVGAATGGAEALLLRRTARGARVDPAGMLLRLLLVGGVLTGAALAGHLLAAAAGWALGLGLGTLVLVRRWS